LLIVLLLTWITTHIAFTSQHFFYCFYILLTTHLTDPDLGTPNESFGGPGKGKAGEKGSEYENKEPRGMILIISEDDNSNNPDDHGKGGVLQFDFDSPIDLKGTYSTCVVGDTEREQPMQLVIRVADWQGVFLIHNTHAHVPYPCRGRFAR